MHRHCLEVRLSSISLLNNAYAHNHNDRGIRMLFQDMDLTDEQRKEVRSIMSSSIKDGRGLRAEMREQSMDAMDELIHGIHGLLSHLCS